MEISAEEEDLLSLTTPGALGTRELHPQCLVAGEVVALCCNCGEGCAENVRNQELWERLQLGLQLLTEHWGLRLQAGFEREKRVAVLKLL